MAQIVKNLPAIWDTWVHSLDQEDTLEKRMATHSNILVWRFPWIGEPGEATVYGGHKEFDTTERLTHTHTHKLFK